MIAVRRRKRAKRVLVLVHEDHVPPETIEGMSDKEILPFKAEYDVTVTLKELGHETIPLGVANDLGVLRDELNSFKPSITFNLLEEFHGVALYDHAVASYLELMKRRYTGCNARGLMLAHDKALSKQILSYHRVPVPEFAVFPMGRTVRGRKLPAFPLIVKSLTAEGSEGIAQASLVHDEPQMRERIAFIHEQMGTDAIVERFVEGRELYVGVFGNHRLQTLPTWELKFTKLPESAPRIATSKVKWDPAYQERRGIVWEAAAGIAPEIEERIHRVCKRTYRSLYLSGYARIDIRLTPEGEFYVLEANPNPDLSYGSEFSDSAEAAGIPYDRLLERIMALGLSYRALWQT